RDGAAPASRFVALFDDAEQRMPQGSVEARVRADERVLSIALPARASTAEFFPYREGFVENASEQVLYGTESVDDGVRLAVRLSDDGVAALRESADALLAAASGVVVVDGTPRELAPRVVAQPLPVGSEISRVAGADAQAPAGTAASGWLPGFGGAARDRGQGLSSIFGPAPGADAGASGI